MYVEFTKENADKCKELLEQLFSKLSKHEKPSLMGAAATIEGFLMTASEVARKNESK